MLPPIPNEIPPFLPGGCHMPHASRTQQRTTTLSQGITPYKVASRERHHYLHQEAPIMPTKDSSSDRHVAVIAFPFSSHPLPLLTVVRSLATAAPNVHFSFFSTAKSNSSLFSASSKHDVVHAPNIKAYDLEDGVPEKYVFVGKPQEDIELFMNAAPENFRKAVKEAVAETGRKVSCLVSDVFNWFAAEMAEEMAVPWLPWWSSAQNSLSAHLYTDIIRDTIGLDDIAGREEETLEFIPGMSKIRIQDLPEGIVFGNLNSLFSRMLHQMGLVLPRAAAILVNSCEELDPTITKDFKSKFKYFLNVGPYNFLSSPSSPSISDAYGCLPWLDNQKPVSVAYISFGTVVTPSPKEIVALAEALETSGVTFLWSLKDHVKAHLPNGFMEKTRVNGMIVPWAPQVEILAHGAIGVFISHCGWNSVLESIAGGVPMICRPFFGDQRINARYVESVWEVGLNVEGGMFTKKGLVGSLDLVLAKEKGKQMREKMKGLKEVVEKAVGPQGSSTENLKLLVNVISTPN